MEMKIRGLAGVTAVVLFVVAPLVAQQHEHEAQQQAKPAQMSMDGMMKSCRERHQAMSGSLDQIARTVTEAKQSNDSSKMRAALEQVETRVAQMQEQMKMCTSMMNMMQNMMSMHGTESQTPK